VAAGDDEAAVHEAALAEQLGTADDGAGHDDDELAAALSSEEVDSPPMQGGQASQQQQQQPSAVPLQQHTATQVRAGAVGAQCEDMAYAAGGSHVLDCQSERCSSAHTRLVS
jgi:hypothetical protein